jgi:hypothetical protein
MCDRSRRFPIWITSTYNEKTYNEKRHVQQEQEIPCVDDKHIIVEGEDVMAWLSVLEVLHANTLSTNAATEYKGRSRPE